LGFTLALRSNGTIWGFGSNASGQLGDGTTTNKSSPVSVVGGFTDWVQVSTSGYSAIGIRANGTAWTWGAAGSGQLGDSTTTSKSSPVSVVGGFTDWVEISGGSGFVAGIRGS
jgi:alpha-tubulin suppressor-like RCC1 family protein